MGITSIDSHSFRREASANGGIRHRLLGYRRLKGQVRCSPSAQRPNLQESTMHRDTNLIDKFDAERFARILEETSNSTVLSEDHGDHTDNSFFHSDHVDNVT